MHRFGIRSGEDAYELDDLLWELDRAPNTQNAVANCCKFREVSEVSQQYADEASKLMEQFLAHPGRCVRFVSSFNC